MAKRKPGRPKKTKKKTPSKKKRSFSRALIGVVIMAVLVFVAAVITHYHFVQKQAPQSKSRIKPKAKPPVKSKARFRVPDYEIYPKKEIPLKKPPAKRKRDAKDAKQLPRVAIIIDDMGYDKALARKLMTLGPALTLSILPHSPFQKMVLTNARQKGIETMLHLPMEPTEYPRVDPGPGALLTSMSPDELIKQLNKNLEALPSIKGVNNHMGSRLTTLSARMYQIFTVLKKRNLYFVDSRTSPDSLCRPSARILMIPYGQRDVFLDYKQDISVVQTQVRKLIRIALNHGEAIGIGHPYSVTFKVLNKELSNLKKKVQLVPASRIVHLVG